MNNLYYAPNELNFSMFSCYLNKNIKSKLKKSYFSKNLIEILKKSCNNISINGPPIIFLKNDVLFYIYILFIFFKNLNSLFKKQSL